MSEKSIAAAPPAQGLPAAPDLEAERMKWWKALQAMECPYTEATSGQNWQAHAHAWDQAIIAAMKVIDPRRAAPSAPTEAAPSEPLGTREWVVKGDHRTIKLTDTGEAVGGIPPAIALPGAMGAAPSEPVAWGIVECDRLIFTSHHQGACENWMEYGEDRGRRMIPLFATPPAQDAGTGELKD